MKRLAVGICALVIATMVQMPLPAQADTYRYWSYWVGGDSWSYSSRGPGFRVPPDGGVEGWRFVVSPKDGSQASPPAAASTYEQLCRGQPPAPEGQKRVVVVIDPGPAGIAPVGETPPQRTTTCVTVPATDNGLQVLQRVSQLRFHSSGLICGIGGFPAAECPGQTASRPASSAPATTAPDIPDPVTVPAPAEVTVPTTRATAPSSATPTPTPSNRTPTSTDTPSPVALALPESAEPSAAATPPPWLAAIGVTMIAALLGLAILVRRGRG